MKPFSRALSVYFLLEKIFYMKPFITVHHSKKSSFMPSCLCISCPLLPRVHKQYMNDLSYSLCFTIFLSKAWLHGSARYHFSYGYRRMYYLKPIGLQSIKGMILQTHSDSPLVWSMQFSSLANP